MMDIEGKISSLTSYVRLGTKEEESTKATDSSGHNASHNTSLWASFQSKAQEPDPWLPGLTKTQRIIGFCLSLLLGLFCFGMASMILPFILIKSRKFVALYTMGSVFTLGSFSLLWGPYHHFKHLTSVDRLPFTLAYFGSMSATLYVAIFMKSTLLTLVFAIFQIVTLLWYIMSYIPGGTAGMKMITRFFSSAAIKTVSKTLPV